MRCVVKRTILFVVAVMLAASAARGELRHVEIRTLGMD